MVERNSYMNFLRLGQQLGDFFTCSNLKITDEKTDSCTVHVVAHCNDLSSLVNHVIQSRKISGGYFVKLGIDGGKGFLKFCPNIVDTALRDETSSPHQQQPLTQRTGKDTGVKRQIIVRVSEELPERHSNIEQIWSLVNANGVKLILVCDMKVANIIYGLQTHSSTHPCTLCNVKSNCLAKSGNLRTLGSINSSLESFQQSGGVVANAKLFGNVIRKPIICVPFNVLILEIILPMELYLLLGVINHLFEILKTAKTETVVASRPPHSTKPISRGPV
nr:uncharacterized protein LOC124807992 [Hydra vulgaris]